MHNLSRSSLASPPPSRFSCRAIKQRRVEYARTGSRQIQLIRTPLWAIFAPNPTTAPALLKLQSRHHSLATNTLRKLRLMHSRPYGQHHGGFNNVRHDRPIGVFSMQRSMDTVGSRVNV
jgi:hypothetical protein